MTGRSMNNADDYDKYRFSGKEPDREKGLNWYYFGARYYDPAIARWHSLDPKADKYPSWSPYNYCMNNPLIFNDPDGKFPYYVHASVISKTQTQSLGSFERVFAMGGIYMGEIVIQSVLKDGLAFENETLH